MNISQKQLLKIEALLVLLLLSIESSIDAFQLEEIFSIYYSLPILLAAFGLYHSLKKERFQIISIILYLAILLLTILSLVHLLLFDTGFGFVPVNIPITHMCAVFLNVAMMSFAILQFKQHTKWQKSSQQT